MSVDHLGGRLNYWLGVKAPRREFQHRYYLFSRHVNQSITSPIVAPASRFSNTTETAS